MMSIGCFLFTLLMIVKDPLRIGCSSPTIGTEALEISDDGSSTEDDSNVHRDREETVLAMDWPHETFLDSPRNNYRLFWKPRTDDILFRVDVRTKGYVGFGLSKNGRMAGSDILVGWVRNGQPFVQDRHGTSRSEPSVDKKQDWFLLGGSENETHTVLVFGRSYDTCDRHDLRITNDTWRVIYAFHEDDPDLSTGSIAYHGRPDRGVKSVLLTQHVLWPQAGVSPQTRFPVEDAVLHWDLRSHKVMLPEDDDTLYWCKLFKLPASIRSKHHVIRHEPIIEEGNEGYVHHLLVYECTSRNSEEDHEFERLVGTEGHLCYEPTIPGALKSCDKLIAVWAIGSKGFVMPDGVGYSLDPDSGAKYFMMEIHYDNPYLQDDIKDSSGIRLFYTGKLREMEVGVLSVGIDPNWKHLIPPKQSATVSYGHCVSKCTRKTLPVGGIRVFAAILHSHLIGRKIQLRHIRGNSELAPIAIDANYDFEYQDYRVFQIPVTILPGDHLIAECTYNSKGRDRMTQGGFTTREEMCLVFIYYYPRVDMSMCHSVPTLATVHASVGVTDIWTGRIPAIIKSPAIYANKSLAEHFAKYDWSKNIKFYQDVTRTGTFEVFCGNHGQHILPESELGRYPRIGREYEEPKGCISGRHGATSVPSEHDSESKENKKEKQKSQRKHNRKKERNTTTSSLSSSFSTFVTPSNDIRQHGSTRETTQGQGQRDAPSSTASCCGALPVIGSLASFVSIAMKLALMRYMNTVLV